MLIPGICTQCGATLSVDKEKDAMICPYCGTPFIVKKAIQKYSIVNNINAENVYVKGNLEKEYKVESGVLTRHNGEATNIKIPEGIKKIGKKVFAGSMIESLEMSDDVVEIDDYAFENCKYLNKIIFSKKLEVIGFQAFWNCEQLEELIFPDSLKIMKSSFGNCNKLKTIYVSGKTIGKVGYSFGTVYTSWNEEPCDGILRNECQNLVNIYIDGQKLGENDERLKYFESTPVGFKYMLKEKQREQEQIIQQRMNNGVCQYCGGKLEGFWVKKCRNCKRVKDY
jgi:DNA-directed RNA polymerase subunit RPC12/RpoP